jgi:Na+/proline symporter
MSIPLYVSSFVVAWMMAHGANSFLVKKARASAVIKKSFTFASIVFALIALELGGSMMLGTCEEAYTTGIYGLLYVVGISIGFILLGLGFAKKIQAMNVESTIDLFEIRYKSPLIRVCASLLSILTTWGLLLGQIIAGKSLIHALGITNEIFFVCLSICTILYAVLGGLRTAGITYSIQLVYTVIVFGGIFVFCLAKEPPSFFIQLLDSPFAFPKTDLSFSTVFNLLVMPALYYLTDQEFARPLFNVSNRYTGAACAAGASAFMLIFSLVPIYFGIKAKALHLVIPDSISPLIPVLAILTNELVVFLAVLGMAAALIAMIDYYLWSISLSITQELGLSYGFFKNNPTVDKIMLVFVGLVATFASYCTTSNAMQILLYSYELYDSCLIVPLLMSYFQADLKKGSAIGAILLGLAGFILVHTIALPISGQIVSFALSGIGFYVGGHAETTLKKFVVLKTSKSAHCGNI